jgi:hypothetical protein
MEGTSGTNLRYGSFQLYGQFFRINVFVRFIEYHYLIDAIAGTAHEIGDHQAQLKCVGGGRRVHPQIDNVQDTFFQHIAPLIASLVTDPSLSKAEPALGAVSLFVAQALVCEDLLLKIPECQPVFVEQSLY